MYLIEQEWRDGAELIPFHQAILLEQDAGLFGLFSAAQRVGCEPPTAATVAAWLRLPTAGDQSRIEAANALQRYLNIIAARMASNSGRLRLAPDFAGLLARCAAAGLQP